MFKILKLEMLVNNWFLLTAKDLMSTVTISTITILEIKWRVVVYCRYNDIYKAYTIWWPSIINTYWICIKILTD